MLRKITRGICCVVLWLFIVENWIGIFETWPFFNQVTNETIALILSMIFGVMGCYGVISIVQWAWERD